VSIVRISLIGPVASRESRGKLWLLAEELRIPLKNLNKIASQVLGRQVECSRLSESNNMKLRRYMRENRRVLSERSYDKENDVKAE
jgi:hypothetical protein